ncbi:hypothetical protein LSH36_251g04056 [Paralvinella palmiformis]|uniref:Methyltransferase type 11 domain-containing protein n=1 Tax=Paralvinella palmiformis TaxID=53620 RepID=A0AAD9N363_9ANNE|nr:hypothetical protein LSH36_251g04056 [Paralvinella palmiformis]
MLSKAEEKRVYRNIYAGKVGDGESIPTDDDTYDGAIAAGCLLPGHMPVDAMLEIIRVVKPGGIIVNVMREEFTWISAQCDVRCPFAQWQREGKWDIIEWAIPESKYFCDKDALVHVYRVCSKQQNDG